MDVDEPLPLKQTDTYISPAVAIGLLVTVAWVILVILFFIFSSQTLAEAFGTPLIGILTLLSIILPIVLVWTLALTAHATQRLKKEANEIRAEMRLVAGELRETADRFPNDQQTIVKQLKLIAEMTIANDKRLQQIKQEQTPTPQIDVVEMNKTIFGDFTAPAEDGQIALPLQVSEDAELPPMPVEDVIAALNFPDNAQDKAGFRALRRAMRDRRLRQMLDGAQFVMSQLTEEGIFMDDLNPDRAVTDAWRRLAGGASGKEVSTVGGVRDKAVLALAKGRMKTNREFRERVHYFLRAFGDFFTDLEPRLKNHEITDLTDTRTARCYMVMARATGAFD